MMKITADDYCLIIDYCYRWRSLFEITELVSLDKTSTRRHLQRLIHAGFVVESNQPAPNAEVRGNGHSFIASPSITHEQIKARFESKKKEPLQANKKQDVLPDYIKRVAINDYHTRIERKRPHVYVGGTAGMV